MRNVIFFLSISIVISGDYCFAQEEESIDQVVYLIGNTATKEINKSHLAALATAFID